MTPHDNRDSRDDGVNLHAGRPRPEDGARAAALDRLKILDTPPEVVFDNLTRLASELCRTPVALISFVREGLVWHKARIGWEKGEQALDQSLLGLTMDQP